MFVTAAFRTRFLLTAIFVATVPLVQGCGGGNRSTGEPKSASAPATNPGGDAAIPEFSVKDLAGKEIKLSDSKGTVRLVSFWATWCAPCREEIPVLKELNAAYATKGLTLLAVSMDQEGASVVKPFIEENKIDYRVLLGTDDTGEAFGGIAGLPTTFFLDRNGKIVESYFGAVPKKILVDKIEQLLAS